MADIFISYSSQDKTIVKRIADLLEKKGWTVWWDRQIPIGQNFDTVIENELQTAGCVLVIWTQRSIASEWVKNEATDAAGRKKLVPVVLEPLTLPLAFRRTEAAMLINWDGVQDHPELSILYQSIENILQHKNAEITPDNKSKDKPIEPISVPRTKISAYGIIAAAGFIVSALSVYYYLRYIQGNVAAATDDRVFFMILVLFGIAASALVFGVMNTYAVLKTGRNNMRLKMVGPGVGVMLIVLGGFYLPPKAIDKTVTIRLFDHNKNPVTQGNVKIYLKEYIRTQSVDNMGQALFTGIPADMAKNKMKVEVSSPGYATKTFDTLLTGNKPIELTMPLTAIVFITGRVTTAADVPIKGVEVSIDGTKYYALTINDGTYNLRLEEYTLGDEISVTTSHKDFEDKTVSLKINSPNISKDIVLNPVGH